MRLGCLPPFFLSVLAKESGTPFAGHRQSHSDAANENAQNKQCSVDAVENTSSSLKHDMKHTWSAFEGDE